MPRYPHLPPLTLILCAQHLIQELRAVGSSGQFGPTQVQQLQVHSQPLYSHSARPVQRLRGAVAQLLSDDPPEDAAELAKRSSELLLAGSRWALI